MNKFTSCEIQSLSKQQMDLIKKTLDPSLEKTKPTKRITRTTRTKQTTSAHSTETSVQDPSEKTKLALNLLNQSLVFLNSLKPLSANTMSVASVKDACELASISASILYEEENKQNKDIYDCKKKHLSFILDLIDLNCLDETFKELQKLISIIYQRFHPDRTDAFQTSSSSKLNTIQKGTRKTKLHQVFVPLGTLLTIKPPQHIDEGTANFVVFAQLALLKGLSKVPPKVLRPVSNEVSLFVYNPTHININTTLRKFLNQ